MAEQQIAALSADIQALKKQVELATIPPSARLAALRSQNEKLKYQKMHLERSIAAQKELPALPTGKAAKKDKKNKGPQSTNADVELTTPATNVPRTSPERLDPPSDALHMLPLRKHITELFTASIESAFPGETSIPIAITSVTGPRATADFQCNSAPAIVKMLKGKDNAPISPKDAGLRIAAHLPASRAVKSVSVTPHGFVLVNLDEKYLGELIDNVIQNGVKPPLTERKRVLVDFSSPNVAKEMHVGHLRSTIIGDCIARLMEFLDHEVLRVNHVGDWGTQFGMLIAHLKDEYPDFETVSPPISDLQAFYKASKKRFDDDEAFQTRARDEVFGLQQGDEVVTKAWKLICDVSRREFQKIYDRLDVRIEEVGESFYQPMMAGVVKMLEDKGMVQVDDGRKIVFVDGFEVPLTIEKSNGSYTYDTSDLAAVNYRINELKADWALYVVDQGQALHFDLVFGCARKAGIYDASKQRVEHVGFGVVLGEDKKKFKTRSGDTIRLADLLDEAVSNAKMIIESKQAAMENSAAKLTPEEIDAAYHAVGYGAVKYNDLKGNRGSDYVFSFERMLDLKGNTAAYILYAYTRIASIARKANVDDVAALPSPVSITEPKEAQLAKHILRFPEVILKITNDLLPHSLCEYLYELSTVFTEFYEACRVIEINEGEIVSVNESRLKLCDSTAQVMAKGFDILGLRYVMRM